MSGGNSQTCKNHEGQLGRISKLEQRVGVLETNVSHIEKDQSEKHNNESKNFKILLSTLITVGIILLGAIGTLHMTKVSDDEFKYHQSLHTKEEADRDAKIQSMYESQIIFQRELTKEMTELKVIIASLESHFSKKND